MHNTISRTEHLVTLPQIENLVTEPKSENLLIPYDIVAELPGAPQSSTILARGPQPCALQERRGHVRKVSVDLEAEQVASA